MPTFDCNEFNTVASALLQGGCSTPAAIRTAVGRSYYSQYGYLRTRIESVFRGSFGEKGWHTQLRQVCREAKEKHLRRIATRLDFLWKLRCDADYYPDRVVAFEDAENAVDTADEVKEKIRNLSDADLAYVHKALHRLIDEGAAGMPHRV